MISRLWPESRKAIVRIRLCLCRYKDRQRQADSIVPERQRDRPRPPPVPPQHPPSVPEAYTSSSRTTVLVPRSKVNASPLMVMTAN